MTYERDANGDVVDEDAHWFTGTHSEDKPVEFVGQEVVTTEQAMAVGEKLRAEAAKPPEEPPDDDFALPFVTRTTWPYVGSYGRDDGTVGRDKCLCGMCDVCRWYKRVTGEDNAKAWQESAAPRVRVVHERPRWPSMQAALEAYVTHMADGYGASSIASVVESVGLAGQISGSSTYGPPKAMRNAEDMAQLKPILARLFPKGERNVTPEECIQILVARTVGRVRMIRGKDDKPHRKPEPVPASELAEHYTIRKSEVAGIVKAGRHRLRVQLSARGLVPMPRRDSRAFPAAQALRARLEART